jgi:hypothetical protein
MRVRAPGGCPKALPPYAAQPIPVVGISRIRLVAFPGSGGRFPPESVFASASLTQPHERGWKTARGTASFDPPNPTVVQQEKEANGQQRQDPATCLVLRNSVPPGRLLADGHPQRPVVNTERTPHPSLAVSPIRPLSHLSVPSV